MNDHNPELIILISKEILRNIAHIHKYTIMLKLRFRFSDN